MTSAQHDCATIREQLIDLLYDELDAPEAAALRKAADACPGCADHLARLEDGLSLAAALPMMEPSPNFDQRLMAMVHQELSPQAAAAAGVKAPTLLARMADRLRELVAGPQVAMATLTLLVAALGVWYLPRHQEPVGAAGDTVVALEPDGEAVATAPAAASVAAPEAPTRAGRRRGRSASAGTVAQQGATPSAATPEGRAGRGGLGAWGPDPTELDRPAAPANEPSAASGYAAAEPTREAQAELSAAAGERVQIAALGGAADEASDQAPQVPAAAPAPQARAPMAAATPRARHARRMGRAPAPSPARMAAAPRNLEDVRSDTLMTDDMSGGGRATVGDRQAYERGLTRYRARDYRGAIDELDRVVTAPSPDARTLVPSALHHIAQSLRASGSCAPAVTRYESLLRRFPGYAQAPRAMMEAADCYRRIGQLSAARRWATRAQSYGATASAARRELLRLDSMEAGHTGSRRRPSRADPASTAASVEEAY